MLSEWSEGDHWKRLLQHTVVKTTLCWVLGLGQEVNLNSTTINSFAHVSQPRNKVSCNVKEHIQLLLDADMAYIAVHVQSILRGRGREMFSTLPEEETQLALNLLQTVR